MSAPGTFSSTEAASSAVRRSPGTNPPSPSMKKQRSASPSQAMPRSAPVSRTLAITNSRFSGSSGFGSWGGEPPARLPEGGQGLGLVVGELAVRLPVGRHELERKLLQDRPDHRAGHAVAAVDDDLERLDRRRVDDLQRAAVEVGVDVDLLVRPAARGVAEAVLDVPAHL